MVHSYLMYGYPTQTIQETIDSLEMVRQLFEAGIVQSGFWHQFALTAHSPIGMNPLAYGVLKDTEELGTFANNDILFKDETGIDHEIFSFGLKKSLYNFMHGIGFDIPVHEWFETKMPRTKVAKDFILDCLDNEDFVFDLPSSKVIWLGGIPQVQYTEKKKKNQLMKQVLLTFFTNKEEYTLQMSLEKGEWLASFIQELHNTERKIRTFKAVEDHYYTMNSDDFESFWYGKTMTSIKELGLLVV